MNLEVALQELKEVLDSRQRKLELALYILSPKVCHKCHKVITDHEELISMYHTGECGACDHVGGYESAKDYEEGQE